MGSEQCMQSAGTRHVQIFKLQTMKIVDSGVRRRDYSARRCTIQKYPPNLQSLHINSLPFSPDRGYEKLWIESLLPQVSNGELPHLDHLIFQYRNPGSSSAPEAGCGHIIKPYGVEVIRKTSGKSSEKFPFDCGCCLLYNRMPIFY